MSALLVAALVIVNTIPTNDQDQLQGSFDARLDRNPYINLNITTEGNGFSNWGQSIEAGDVRDLRVNDGRVSFKITRPAGTFSMEGKGNEARVRGTFDFMPSEPFRQQLAALGFNGLTSERLFVIAVGDLSIADVKYIDQFTTDDLTTTQLVKMIQHGVKTDFVRGMADAGFRELSSAQLINARDHGVTPAYISNLQKFGYKLSLADYIRGKDHGVNERHVAEMRELGFKNLTFEQLVKSRDHGVTADFVREFAELGYNDLTVEEYIRLRDHGVGTGFAQRMNKQHGEKLEARELIQLKNRGQR